MFNFSKSTHSIAANFALISPPPPPPPKKNVGSGGVNFQWVPSQEQHCIEGREGDYVKN
jgi:hypothetical protein